MFVKKSVPNKYISFYLLALCFLLGSLVFIFKFYWLFATVQYSWWIISGISLFYSTRIPSAFLKRVLIVIHLVLMYGIVLGTLLGFVSFGKVEYLLFPVAYVLIVGALHELEKKKAFFIMGLIIPMSISTLAFIYAHYLIIFQSHSFESYYLIPLLMLMVITGLIGLYAATKLETSRRKFYLLFINYLFSTYFNVVLLLLFLVNVVRN